MKYLVVGAVLALAITLIYVRLRPYLQLLRRVSQALRGTLSDATATQRSIKGENQLIRCPVCGVWVPRRSRQTTSALATYCSRECLEQAASKQSKEKIG